MLQALAAKSTVNYHKEVGSRGAAEDTDGTLRWEIWVYRTECHFLHIVRKTAARKHLELSGWSWRREVSLTVTYSDHSTWFLYIKNWEDDNAFLLRGQTLRAATEYKSEAAQPWGGKSVATGYHRWISKLDIGFLFPCENSISSMQGTLPKNNWSLSQPSTKVNLPHNLHGCAGWKLSQGMMMPGKIGKEFLRYHGNKQFWRKAGHLLTP